MLKKLSFALAAILSVGLLASCVINADDDDETSGIDYSDYTKSGDYALIVKNNTSKNLVCFKGNPSKDTVLGGVRGTSQVGLKKNNSLFTASHDFVLFLVTEDDYNANKDNLEALKNAPFGQVYAYYNAETKNTRVYEISSHMGGNCKVIVNNTTKFNVELREGGLYEPALGYVASMDINKSFPLEMPDSGMYYIYPVFRKFDKKSAEIISSFPTYSSSGKNVVVPFGFDNESTVAEFDADDWVGNTADFKMSPSCGYVNIHNGTSTATHQLYAGNGTALQTTSGFTVINTTKTRMFDIQMQKLGSDSYAKSAEFSGYKYGNSAVGKKPIAEITVEAGKLYTYHIKQLPNSMDPSDTYGYWDGATISYEDDGVTPKAITGTASGEPYEPEDEE